MRRDFPMNYLITQFGIARAHPLLKVHKGAFTSQPASHPAIHSSHATKGCASTLIRKKRVVYFNTNKTCRSILANLLWHFSPFLIGISIALALSRVLPLLFRLTFLIHSYCDDKMHAVLPLLIAVGAIIICLGCIDASPAEKKSGDAMSQARLYVDWMAKIFVYNFFEE